MFFAVCKMEGASLASQLFPISGREIVRYR